MMAMVNVKIRIKNPIMDVPITFLGEYNPDQFEIIWADKAERTGFSEEQKGCKMIWVLNLM